MTTSFAIKRLGIYGALHTSSIQFNSAIFRCVVGILANVPPTTVAIITGIEFLLNCILEVPTGRLADRYGRIPCAILGHISVILGLSCGYTALLLGGQGQAAEWLFIAHGFFIGFTRPLISGSVNAFYRDAIEREEKRGEHRDSGHSMTLSKTFGKYFSTISILAAFGLLYLLNGKGMTHHAFLPGIILWAVTLCWLAVDYRRFGDRRFSPSPLFNIAKMFKNGKVLAATFYTISIFAFAVIVGGYLLISIGRELGLGLDNLEDERTWILMFLFALSSQGIGSAVAGHILPKLVKKVSTKNYISLFYIVLIVSNIVFLRDLKEMGFLVFAALIVLYGIFYVLATHAIMAKSRDMLLNEFPPQDHAMALSLVNMPGVLVFAGYSLYLTRWGGGAPSLREAFLSVGSIAAICLLVHLALRRNEGTK
ncbi:MAG: MFS transporter [Bacteriovoracales bacterium]|nr:MFS transporter [Bacteriovoracales bacterium]